MAGAITGTHIKCRWVNGMQEFYDAATFETVHVNAPFYFTDDFVGHAGLEVGDIAETWEILAVGTGATTTPHIIAGTGADAATGVVEIMVDDGNNEAQDSGIYWGDQTAVSVYNDTVFECRLAMHVIPEANTTAVFGMCGHHNLDKDTVAESAWFRLQGSAALLVESDDTTGAHENDAVATGITLVEDEYHIFRIDFGNLSDVRFYVDGTRVAGATTFDMSDLTATEAMFQPYFMLDHAAVAENGSLYIDKCSIWGARSTRVLI